MMNRPSALPIQLWMATNKNDLLDKPMSENTLEILVETTYDDGVPIRLSYANPFLWSLQLKSNGNEWVYPPGWPEYYKSKPAPMANIRQGIRDGYIGCGNLMRMLRVCGFDVSGKYLPVIRRLLPNAELVNVAFTRHYVSNFMGGPAWRPTRRIEYWVQLTSDKAWRCMSRAYYPSYFSGRTGHETTSLIAEFSSVDDTLEACHAHYADEPRDGPDSSFYECPVTRQNLTEALKKLRKRVRRLNFFDDSYRSLQARKAMDRLAAIQGAEEAARERERDKRRLARMEQEKERQRMGEPAVVRDFSGLIEEYGDLIPPGYLIHATHFPPPPIGPIALGLLKAWNRASPLPHNLPSGIKFAHEDQAFLEWLGVNRQQDLMRYLAGCGDADAGTISDRLKELGEEAFQALKRGFRGCGAAGGIWTARRRAIAAYAVDPEKYPGI